MKQRVFDGMEYVYAVYREGELSESGGGSCSFRSRP